MEFSFSCTEVGILNFDPGNREHLLPLNQSQLSIIAMADRNLLILMPTST